MSQPIPPAPARQADLERALREREEQLRRESERLALALDAARASIWDYDVDAGIVVFDAGWLDMLGAGATPHRATIRQAFGWVHPEERAAALHEVQACLAGRQDTYDQEYRVRHADGSWVWVHSRGRVSARSAQGRALRMIGTNTDITRRKTAELATVRDAAFLASLNQLTMSLLQRRAKTDVLCDLAEKAVALFGATAQVEVALVEGDELVIHACSGPHCDVTRKRVGRAEATGAWRAMHKRLPVIGGAAGEPPTAFFPILLDDRALGVLAITRPPPEPPFNPDELGKGLLLSQLAALVIHNAGIYEDAVHLAEARAADLADREERYRQVVENINQGFYTANARSLFTYCNPAISLVTGMKAEDLVGTSSFRLVAEPDRARVVSLYRTWAAGTERHVTAEFRVDRPGGGQIWVEQLTQIIRDADGRVAEFRNFLRDITERKAATEALRESEQRFRSVFDKSPVCIALLSLPDGIIVENNTATEAIFGYTMEEVRGRTSAELGLWADRADRDRYLAALRTQGHVPAFEARMRRKDGSFFTALYSGSLVTIGARQYSLNTIQDITPRKQAEEQRDRSLALAQATLEATTDGILVLDDRGRMETFNHNFVAMWRIPPRLLANQDDAPALQHVRDQLQDPAAFDADGPHSGSSPTTERHDVLPFKDGRVFERHVRPLRMGNRITGRVLSFRDVTQARQAEAALRESETKFRSVFDNSPIPIVLLTQIGGTVVEVNRAAERTFGFTREETLGRTTLDLNIWADPGDRERYMDLIRRQGSFQGAEMRMRVKDGTIITLLCNAGMVMIGPQLCLLNSFIDITAQKEAEAALRESELRFRTLADVAPVGIFSTDAAGRTVFVNRRWCEIAGLWPDEAMGDRWLQAVHPDDRAALAEGWARAVAAGSPTTVRFRFLLANGEVTYLVGHSRPQLDATGRITGHVGTITDITSLHLAEESRRKTELQLRQAQKMESLGTLAGGIAHDFNNILTGILGYAQLARLDLEPHHPSTQWLDNLATAGHRAKGLVQQILTFSRKRDGQITPMQLQPVLKDALGLLRSTVPAMIELRQEIDPACPPVMADATQIHQIVMNLCTNALHALPPERGWIEVGLQLRELTANLDAATTVLPPGRYAVLSVGDNGHGMSPGILERIFEPFFTTKESGKGTGLGLAVVHGIVQSHGGAITVRSTPGLGTRFEIFLPALQPAPTGSPHSQPSFPLPRGRGQRLLFVDDDTLAGPAIARLVRALGYQVTEFNDPRQALASFEQDPGAYELVITDLAMPDMAGDQLASRLLAIRPDLPIVLISGYLEPGRHTSLQEMGVRAVLEKPPAMDALSTTLARLLPG